MMRVMGYFLGLVLLQAVSFWASVAYYAVIMALVLLAAGYLLSMVVS